MPKQHGNLASKVHHKSWKSNEPNINWKFVALLHLNRQFCFLILNQSLYISLLFTYTVYLNIAFALLMSRELHQLLHKPGRWPRYLWPKKFRPKNTIVRKRWKEYVLLTCGNSEMRSIWTRLGRLLFAFPLMTMNWLIQIEPEYFHKRLIWIPFKALFHRYHTEDFLSTFP